MIFGLFLKDLVKPSTAEPAELVSQAYAYYMICMAYEIAREQTGAAIEDSQASVKAWEDLLGELKQFMKAWEGKVAIDELDFLADPERLRPKSN